MLAQVQASGDLPVRLSRCEQAGYHELSIVQVEICARPVEERGGFREGVKHGAQFARPRPDLSLVYLTNAFDELLHWLRAIENTASSGAERIDGQVFIAFIEQHDNGTRWQKRLKEGQYPEASQWAVT